MTLADLKDAFRLESGYQSSEGFDTKLDGWLSNAIRAHDPSLSLESLPADSDQVQPIVIKAWISLCYARAGKFSNQGDSKGAGGYGTDRNTPYYKNIDLAQKLEGRYDRLVADLENTDAGGTIHQSNLVLKSRRTDSFTAPLPPPIIELGIRAGSLTATSVILTVMGKQAEDHAETILYTKTNPGIFQDWNFNTDDGVPQHALDAERLAVFQYQPPSIKIETLEPETLHYFVVVVHTTTGKYYYSNEVVVETPAA